jgi:WD40 repeat protein
MLGNEVTGTATGGYEEFATSEGNNIHLLDYHNGELVHFFVGGDHNTGHIQTITCLLHDGKYLFSGSQDERILCWDTVERKLLRCLLGHESSIVALASEYSLLISSAADATMRLWDKHTGDSLRVVFGHSKSVMSIEIGKQCTKC